MFSRLIFSALLFVFAKAEEGDFIVQVGGECLGDCQTTVSSASGCISQSLGGSEKTSWVLLKCKGRVTSLSSGNATFTKAARDQGLRVFRVEEDSVFKKNVLWGVDEVDGISADGERCPSNKQGLGILVAVLDTGCTPIVRSKDDYTPIKCKNYVDDDGTPVNYCRDGKYINDFSTIFLIFFLTISFSQVMGMVLMLEERQLEASTEWRQELIWHVCASSMTMVQVGTVGLLPLLMM